MRDKGQIEEHPNYLFTIYYYVPDFGYLCIVGNIGVLKLKTFIIGYGNTWFYFSTYISGIIFYSFRCEFCKLVR